MKEEVNVAINGNDKMLILKNKEKEIKSEVKIADDLMAPVAKGQKVGEVILTLGEKELGSFIITAQEDIPKKTYLYTVSELIRRLVFIEN